MKVTKWIVSGLVVLAMAFALVSSSAAGWNVSAKDADNPGHFSTGTPYPCGVESPAYTDYIDARALPCTERDRDSSRRTPEPMGSPGF
ncbi:MAG: hypothetical protein ABSF90_30885 [Syntrophobacteraceae bacterium]|jgi:hypothetical protein